MKSSTPGFVRASALVAVTTILGTALVGCTAQGGIDCLPEGPAASLVSAPGTVGSKPSVSIPTPLYAEDAQRAVLVEGDGAILRHGDIALMQYTILNGRTGHVLEASSYTGEGSAMLFPLEDSSLQIVREGLLCAAVGSRIVVAGNGDETHAGQASPVQGIAADDSFLFVLDIVDAIPGRASGAPQPQQAKLPAVVLAPNGAPGITVPPNQSAPTEVTVVPLQLADGAVLTESDTVVVKYTSVNWGTKKVGQSNWLDGGVASIALGEPGALPDAVREAIVGEPLGSQLMVIVPEEGKATVWVVDLLGTR